MGREIEFIIDDSPVVISDDIKKMTREERDDEIKRLETEAKREREHILTATQQSIRPQK